MITFIYYDQEGERHEVSCLELPKLTLHTCELKTETGDVVVYLTDIQSYKMEFEI